MKKLLSVLAIALLVNLTVAKAQTPAAATAPATPVQKETVVKDAAMPQCHGTTVTCPKSCMDEKAKASSSTTTLSENYANAGSAPETDKKETKATCSDHSKACCKSNSRASSITKNMKPAKSSAAIVPKETAIPKQ